MRLTKSQIAAIKRAVRESYGENARIWLFGSRADDTLRGGDIDLLIRPEKADHKGGLMRKIAFLGKLERAMGERKVDLVIEGHEDMRPIVQIAHDTGVRL